MGFGIGLWASGFRLLRVQGQDSGFDDGDGSYGSGFKFENLGPDFKVKALGFRV